AIEDAQRDAAARVAQVLLDEAAQEVLVAFVAVAQAPLAGREELLLLPRLLRFGQDGLQRHHRGVAAGGKAAVLVEHEGHAARHAGGKVAAGAAEYDYRSARHVLAAVIAGTLDDGSRARVPHAEALAGNAAVEGLAFDGPVHDRVADHDVL